MSGLPIIKTGNVALDLYQTRMKSELDPVIASSLLQGNLLSNIQLSASSPTQINHKLGRMQRGWFITDQNAQARIYRFAPLNASTLTLSSDANVVVSLWVF